MYTRENFTDEEISILNRYFTNVDKPVFVLINLPEVVKGALFARYSRSSKSLRRLFLDEFYSNTSNIFDGILIKKLNLIRLEPKSYMIEFFLNMVMILLLNLGLHMLLVNNLLMY